MSDPVTQGQFFEAINQLRADQQEQHKRVRETIETGFEKFGQRFDLHEKDDRLVEKRLTRVETERELEAKQHVKRGVWVALFTSAGLTGLLEAIKLMAGR